MTLVTDEKGRATPHRFRRTIEESSHEHGNPSGQENSNSQTYASNSFDPESSQYINAEDHFLQFGPLPRDRSEVPANTAASHVVVASTVAPAVIKSQAISAAPPNSFGSTQGQYASVALSAIQGAPNASAPDQSPGVSSALYPAETHRSTSNEEVSTHNQPSPLPTTKDGQLRDEGQYPSQADSGIEEEVSAESHWSLASLGTW